VAKAFQDSTVEASDHGLQNTSSESSKERGVSALKTLSKPVEDKWIATKCAIKLSKSPWRSISNQNIGDPNRGQLGDNGWFVVHENLNSKGIEKFVASVPKNIHEAIFGNAGKEPCFAWDACNIAHCAGGTTIAGAEGSKDIVAFRRFHFAFTSNALISVALYHMFYERQGLLEEFFNPKGSMFASEANFPDHKFVKAELDMDVDDPNVRRAPCTPRKMKVKLGYDTTGPSQPN
jgi:hypothetical protein